MQVFLLRHGIAEEAHDGMPDSDRALTAEGKRKVRRVLALAGAIRPNLVLTSPFRRTRETAALAIRAFQLPLPAEDLASLAPGHAAEEVWNVVAKRRKLESVLLVGHNPQLSHLGSFLIGAPPSSLELRKGALAKIEVKSFRSKKKGILVWCLTPGLAKRIDQSFS